MTQLQKRESNTALAEIPEHLRGEFGNRDGKENMGRGDLIVPRLSLAQAMTPELKKTNENYNPDLEEGQFFNSVTGEIYGESVTVIPLHFFKQYIEFKPKDEGGGIVKMYEQGEVPPARDLAFVDGSKPRCTEFKNRMSLILKDDGQVTPIVVAFKSTGLKAAKQWNYLIAEKNLPAYAYTYKLTSKPKTGSNGEYQVVTVVRGEFTPAALYESAKSYFAALQEAGVKVDVSGIEQEEKGSATFDAEHF